MPGCLPESICFNHYCTLDGPHRLHECFILQPVNDRRWWGEPGSVGWGQCTSPSCKTKQGCRGCPSCLAKPTKRKVCINGPTYSTTRYGFLFAWLASIWTKKINLVISQVSGLAGRSVVELPILRLFDPGSYYPNHAGSHYEYKLVVDDSGLLPVQNEPQA